MISSGSNRPLLQIGRQPWKDGLIALRENGAIPADSVVDALVNEGVARYQSGRAVPTCMIVSLRDGQALANHASERAHEFLLDLLPHIDHLSRNTTEIPQLSSIPADDLALLLYSNVLLDNWQINGVEAEWLDADRPKRAGGRYYCAALQRENGSATEAFGIWGNASRSIPRWRIGVYGNNRGQPGLHNVRGTALAQELGIDTASVPRERRFELAIEEIARLVDRGAVDQHLESIAKRYGFWVENRSTLLVLPTETDSIFSDLARELRPTLVLFLRRIDESLTLLQRDAGYQALSTAEFRIWWYHFFYSAVTQELVERKLIPRAHGNRVTYLIHSGDEQG